MQLFYITDSPHDNFARIADEEWRHCQRVLRKKIGDEIHFVDGKGTYYRGTLYSESKKEGTIQIQEYIEDWKTRPYRIHMVIAPTKNMNRMEWAVEKMVEFGVDEISLIKCRRSERKVIKPERLEKIAISAMKQSLKAMKPQINGLIAFNEFINNEHTPSASKYIAHLTEDCRGLMTNYQAGNDVIILIGPEGDFADEEILQATQNGFEIVHLGDHRLRTETAAVAATHTIHLLNALNT